MNLNLRDFCFSKNYLNSTILHIALSRKAIETGIILSIDQVAGDFFVKNKQRFLILAHFEHIFGTFLAHFWHIFTHLWHIFFWQFSKPFHVFELFPGAAQL